MRPTEDDFYIGYHELAPESIRRSVKTKVMVVVLVVAVAAVAFAIGQSSFKNGTFELGKLTFVQGTLHTVPYPVLRVELANGITKDVLLLGFGKFGAEAGLLEMAEGEALDGLKMKLQGTLIYYDGATLMQLEPNVEGTYEVLGREEVAGRSVPQGLGSATLKGEIIDPKCYFGVMKPGHGKIHRSCAVRCISGGIPPVFMTTNENGVSNYFLVTDQSGNPANDIVLDHIGKPCEITGELYEVGDWTQLRTNMGKIVELGTKSSVY